MLPKPLRVLWGDLTSTELKKYGLLSCIITLILGNYWLLRTMKNAMFNDLVGFVWQPYAKLINVFVLALVVLGFSKLVDMFQKEKLFYILATTYGLLFLFLGFAVAHPQYFSLSETSALYPFFQGIPGKFIGWFSYALCESSSLMIILFWGFVASVTKPESAKKGYPMIISCIQLGTIGATWFVANYATTVGVPLIVAIGGILFLLVPGFVKLYTVIIPKEEDIVESKKEKTGFFAGLKIIATKPYVMAIFAISTLYEVIAIILEFQMFMIASGVFTTRDTFASFNGRYGMYINLLAFLFALIGTSFFMRRFGLRFCLIMYPTLVGITVGSLFMYKIFGASNIQYMWALFAGMMMIKGFSYALNNPTKEVMYIPTSKDVRFKAKTWIESFGGRAAKGTGSLVNASLAHNVAYLLSVGTVISLGIVGIWIFVAYFLGTSFNKLQKENRIIE